MSEDTSSSSLVKGVSTDRVLRRADDGTYRAGDDRLAIEEPLEIRVRNKPFVVTMRTPGNDDELAAGFLVSEGIVRRRGEIKELAPCAVGPHQENTLNVSLDSGVRLDSGLSARYGAISVSCGICGKASIDALAAHFPPVASDLRVPARVILQLPERLREAQQNFRQTGGLHAAALFDAEGRLLLLREDVGRHNAVDKVIGRAFLDRQLPLDRGILMVSGRTSFEILQKALAGGIAVVVAVSAPSSLSVSFARENGQTLVGFLRPPTMNIYSHAERILLDKD